MLSAFQWRKDEEIIKPNVCSVMCLLHMLCCSPVSVLVGCAHLGVHTAAGGEGSSIFCSLLPGGWTDIKANVQRCLLPGEERSLYSSAAPLAAL